MKDPGSIRGALFLFSASLALEPKAEALVRTRLVGNKITSWLDEAELARLGCREYPGIGPDPYSYPIFPKSGAAQLGTILNELDRLPKEGLEIPMWVAHAQHDDVVKLEGVLRLFQQGRGNRELLVVASPEVGHFNLVFEDDVRPDPDAPIPACVSGAESAMLVRNPMFAGMMTSALHFFLTTLP